MDRKIYSGAFFVGWKNEGEWSPLGAPLTIAHSGLFPEKVHKRIVLDIPLGGNQ